MKQKNHLQHRLLGLLLMLLLMVTFSVTASAAAPKLKLSKTTLKIEAEKYTYLSVTYEGKKAKPKWTTSNSKVATISTTGRLTAKAAGKTTITAVYKGKIVKCRVTVTKRPLYKKLYKQFLESGTVGSGYNAFKPTQYRIIDIDKKGVPELVIYRNRMPFGEYHVYTVKNNKLKYSGYCTGKGYGPNDSLTYATYAKGILVSGWTNHVGGAWNRIYSLNSKGELVSIRWAYEDMYGYQIQNYSNPEYSTSKSNFLAYYNKYFTKRAIGKFYSNTEANRNKI